MIDTVLFDLDGTLIDTNILILDSFQYVFDKYFPELKYTHKDFLKYIGPTLKDSFETITDDPKFVQTLIDDYRDFNMSNHDRYVRPFNNLNLMLETLFNKGIKLGIVSSKKEDTVRMGLRLFDIEKYFKVVLCQEQVKKHKPDPEGILMGMEMLGSKNAIYVGDNKSDILAGKNANVLTIGVSYSYKVEDLKTANPDYMIDDLSEIIKIVGDLNELF